MLVSIFLEINTHLKNLVKLTKKISENIKKGALLLIETTLPPGTYEKILIPEIKNNFEKRYEI